MTTIFANDTDLKNKKGFTLLEVMLSLALMTLLGGGIFVVSNGVFQLSGELKQDQESTYQERRLIEILNANFIELPGNAEIRLTNLGTSNQSHLYLKNVPFAFQQSTKNRQPFFGVILATQKESNQETSLHLYYLSEEMSRAYERGGSLESLNSTSVRLGKSLKSFKWQIQDPITEDWKNEWPRNSRRPHLIRLSFQYAGQTNPVIEYTFWIPKRQ